MSNDDGMKIDKLFQLWWGAYGDTPLTMKKLFGLLTNYQHNLDATKNTRQTFRQYLQYCGMFDVAGPETKLGLYLAKNLGRHGDYYLSRVQNVHQGAWQWCLEYIAPNSPTPEQIKQAKCYVLVPRGASRFSREPSANFYEQKVRQLGHTADVIFHRQGGYAVRLYDVDSSEADSIARTVLLSVVEITSPLKSEGKKTVVEGDSGLPAIGYFPEQKFLDRALVEDHARTGGVHRPTPFLGFEWRIFD